jgi:hypothetical protein
MRILVSFLLATQLFGSCKKDDQFVHHDDPPRQERSNRTYPILQLANDKKIDILWIIDNSGSMGNIQADIVRNSALFMESFKDHKFLEWKMGLMSTDKNQAPFLGFNVNAPFNHLSASPVNTFERAVDSLKTNGSASEYVFHNVYRAMVGQQNLNHFFREGAHLAVIMVTDEEEQSDGINRTRYEPLALLNALRGLKASDRIVRFYGAFNFKDLQDCRGSFAEYADSPFEKIINESGGLVTSACVSDFGTGLAEIGNDIVSLLKTPSILLKERPIIESISVLFNGLKLKGGPESAGGQWYYSKYYNSINFYNLDFAGGDLQEADITIDFDIDDGVDRENE